MSTNINTIKNATTNQVSFLDILTAIFKLANTVVTPTSTDIYMPGGTRIRIAPAAAAPDPTGRNSDVHHQVSYDKGVTWGDAIKTFPDLYNTKNANIENVKDIKLIYTGAGTAATVTIAANILTTTITGGPGGENLNIDLTAAAYDTLTELVAYINAFAGSVYTAILRTSVDGTHASTTLQDVTALDIKSPASQELGQANMVLVTFNKWNDTTAVYDKWEGYVPVWEWHTLIKTPTSVLPQNNYGRAIIRSFDDIDKMISYERTGTIAAGQTAEGSSVAGWTNWTLKNQDDGITFDEQFQYKISVTDTTFKTSRGWIRHFVAKRDFTYMKDYWPCENVSNAETINMIRRTNKIILPGTAEVNSGSVGGKYSGQLLFADPPVAAVYCDAQIVDIDPLKGSIAMWVQSDNTLFGVRTALWYGITAGTIPIIQITKSHPGAGFYSIRVRVNNSVVILDSPNLSGGDTWTHVLYTWNHPATLLNNYLTVQYVGASANCGLTLSGNTLTTQTQLPNVPAEDMSLDLTNAAYDTLSELVAAISGWGGGGIYTAVIDPGRAGTEPTIALNDVPGTGIKSASLLLKGAIANHRLYIDGTLAATGTAGDLTSGADKLRFGNDLPAIIATAWNRGMDDIKIFSEALK